VLSAHDRALSLFGIASKWGSPVVAAAVLHSLGVGLTQALLRNPSMPLPLTLPFLFLLCPAVIRAC